MKQEDNYMIKEEGHNQMQSQLLNILQNLKKKINKDKSAPSRYKQKNKNKNIFLRSAPEFMVEKPV